MKNIKYILLVLFSIFITTSVYAADFNITMSGNNSINPDSEFTITVGVSNANNLWGFKAPISYDSSKITLINYSGLNGFGLAVGSNLVSDSSEGKNGSVNVAKLAFKATSNFKVGESVNISLGNAEGSDGEKTFIGEGCSHKVTMAPPLSSNNYLTSLSVSPQNIDFNAGKKVYNITVENDVTSINISATKEDDKAKISGIGNKELKLYNNTFYVVVTAENGNKNTYTINVIRKDKDGNIKELSSNNKLKELSIKNYQFLFNPEILEYTILLKNEIVDTDINAVKEDDLANVTIHLPDKFENGNNIISIKVIAENGDELEYKINAISLKNTTVNTTKPIENNKSDKITFGLILVELIKILAIVGTIIFLVKKKIILFNFKGKNYFN